MCCFSDIEDIRYFITQLQPIHYTLFFVAQKIQLVLGISLLSDKLYIIHCFRGTKDTTCIRYFITQRQPIHCTLVFVHKDTTCFQNTQWRAWQLRQFTKKKCRRACIIQRIVVPLHPLLRNRATERFLFLQVGLFFILMVTARVEKRAASVLPRNEKGLLLYS